MAPLTTTSYALLALLNLQPWSGYDLAKQMDRSLRYVWPRAVSAIYQEPKNLVAHGLAAARTEQRGRRAKTIYTITPRGRRALAAWLAQASLPPRFESEALVRVSFPDAGTPKHTLATLEELLGQMETLRGQLEAQVSSYLGPDRGPFPGRLHVIALDARFVTEQVVTLQRWARWAVDEVAQWPSTRRADTAAALKSLTTTRDLLIAAGNAPAAVTGLTIRDGRVEEFDAIASLILSSYAEYAAVLDPPVWEWYRLDLADVAARAASATTLVAQLGPEVVGTVSYLPPAPRRSRKNEGRDPGVAEVRALAVLAEHRRGGIGRALIEHCIEQARTDGATRLELHTHRTMRAARALYAELGFVPTGRDVHAPSRAELERFALALGPLGSNLPSGPRAHRTT